MKRIFLVAVSIIAFFGFSFANSGENLVQLQGDKIVNELKPFIYKNGNIYKNIVLKKLNSFKNDQNSELIKYVIGKISEVNVKFGIALYPTPVLNTGDWNNIFFNSGKGPLLDGDEQIAQLETIGFTGTVFVIKGEHKNGENTIYNVETSEYPYPGNYYIDSRFVKVTNYKPTSREIILPSKQEILKRLLSYTGYGYVRGGNMLDGVSKINELYKLSGTDNKTYNKQILSGFDCSGILYSATNGYTPRNTSKIIKFGSGLNISGLSIDEIANQLQPLDIIGWKGHILIVIDKDNIIESRLDYDPSMSGNQNGGVKISSIKERLSQIMQERVGVNNYDDPLPEGKKKFVIRRWINN